MPPPTSRFEKSGLPSSLRTVTVSEAPEEHLESGALGRPPSRVATPERRGSLDLPPLWSNDRGRRCLVFGVASLDQAERWALELRRVTALPLGANPHALRAEILGGRSDDGEESPLSRSLSNSAGRRRSLSLLSTAEADGAVGLSGAVYAIHRDSGGAAAESTEGMTDGGAVVDQATYIRSHFFASRGGNYFLFWGRLRLRASMLFRLGAVLVSYPFVVIYAVLDMDQIVAAVKRGSRSVTLLGQDVSFVFDNARRVVVTFNLVVLLAPSCLVYLVIAPVRAVALARYGSTADGAENLERSVQSVVFVCVLSYAAAFLLPIFLAIWHKNQATKTMTDVVDGTFCFRPSYKLRLTRAAFPWVNPVNLATLGGILLEFLLHSIYCLPKCQLDPKQCRLANLELPPENLMEAYFHVKWRVLFWAVIACTVFNAAVFIVHGVVSGKKKFRLANDFWSGRKMGEGHRLLDLVPRFCLLAFFKDPSPPCLLPLPLPFWFPCSHLG
mmetsp:Transcript_55756/g.126683  ORF Transcript_55756/g.126683 Transcript_55756/m.126683 type:complete len:499 (-) Transcript_55756:623-2119(-)